MNKKAALVVCAVLASVLVAFLLARHFWFPSVADMWFQPEDQQLRHAPANLLVFRETRLESRRPGGIAVWMGSQSGQEPEVRYVGRNLPLAKVISMAYQCEPSRVVMPPGAPTNHFDLLDTLKHQPAERLREAIKKSTGYVADLQDCETPVWQLEVRDASALKVSADGEQPGVRFNTDGRFLFTHMQIGRLVGFLESSVSRPVVDQTGLQDYYDFSIAWSWSGLESATEENVKKSLGDIGLVLVDGTDTMHMLVVHR